MRILTPLSTSFESHGFRFYQEWRQGNLAMYRKSSRSHGWVGYEVIRIRHHDGYTIAGRYCPPAEVYPRSEKWGVDGFSCASLSRAYEKVAEMGIRGNKERHSRISSPCDPAANNEPGGLVGRSD